MRLGYPPGRAPPAPRIMQEDEVGTVVGHECPAVLKCAEKVNIVVGLREAKLACRYDVMPASAEEVCYLPRYVVIELEAGHQSG